MRQMGALSHKKVEAWCEKRKLGPKGNQKRVTFAREHVKSCPAGETA